MNSILYHVFHDTCNWHQNTARWVISATIGKCCLTNSNVTNIWFSGNCYSGDVSDHRVWEVEASLSICT